MATAVDVAKDAERAASVIGDAASIASSLLPWATLVAGFFPGAASVIAAMQIAAPIIAKIKVAAPLVQQAIESGMPIAEAIDKASPQILPHVKQVYAIFANADPARPETAMTASDVSDTDALAFAAPALFGRHWTAEEQQRWWDRADGMKANEF